MVYELIETTIEDETILCPICKGEGHIDKEVRLNLYDSKTERVPCYYCRGKRVVNKKTIIEYGLVVD